MAVLTASVVLLPSRPALADQQSSVQARISALGAQLTAIGAQVHALTFAYTSAQVEVASLGQQLEVDQARAERAAAKVDRTDAALRQEVLEAYMGGFSGPGAGSPAGTTGGGIADPAVRYGYISIATSGVQDSLDSYRTARLQLRSALDAVEAQQHAAQAAAASADQARRSALATATRANAKLTGLETQLAQLEQQAASARAAAAAEASRRPAAPAPAGSTSTTQGGPVNGGLVAMVRAQVTPAAPSAPAVPRLLSPAPAPSVAPPTTSTTAVPPPPPPTTVPPTTVAPVPSPQPSGSASGQTAAGGVWLQLRLCESGDDYQANTGNGFYGAYQFSQQTWTGLGYPGRPDLEPPAMQDQAAQQLQAQSGWGQWPACSAALGLT